MSEAKGIKIRNLIEVDNVHVCFNDCFLQMVEVTKSLIHLEYGDKKSELRNAKEALKELDNKLAAFNARLNGEVTDDVFLRSKEKNVNYNGNAQSLMKYRAEN